AVMSKQTVWWPSDSSARLYEDSREPASPKLPTSMNLLGLAMECVWAFVSRTPFKSFPLFASGRRLLTPHFRSHWSEMPPQFLRRLVRLSSGQLYRGTYLVLIPTRRAGGPGR